MGLVLPGTRPYHLLDFFVTFFAPGVPAGTLRDFTKRAPGVYLSQGRPSASIQQSWSQYCTTVTLNKLLAIVSSLFLVEGLCSAATVSRSHPPDIGQDADGSY